MDPQILKNISQIVVFVGMGLVLLGGIGNWFIGNKLLKIEKEQRILVEKERDKANQELKKFTSTNLLLTQFYSEIDNKVSKLYFEFLLNKGYSAKEYNDFELYIDFGPLKSYYEITSTEVIKSNESEKIHLAGHTIKAYPSDQAIEKPWIEFASVPISIFDYMSFDIWFVNRRKPNNFKIRDLQGGFFSIYLYKKYLPHIKEIRLIANDWIVFDVINNKDKWDKSPTPSWLKNKQLKDLYYLISLSNRGIRLGFNQIDLFSILPQKSEE